ncbi:calpastatin isoform X20 [Colossoma macropomum]|uniref:calpastatin isoform X20 n=1 Tax=Colossoma macropomum TaxID=42526 RepID=UPI001863DD46|nr:calpastatin isoform X20 [Colossoma macropomum]
MGQFFSWFRGSQEPPALQNVAVEQQVTLTGYEHSEISSQAKQPTPTPAAPVSTVKPAEYEKGSASASAAGSAAKPGTTAPSAATTAASTAPTSTAATVSAGVSTGAKVSGGVSTGASVSGAPPTGAASSLSTQSGAPKVTPQTTPISPAKAPPVSAGSGAASGTGGAGATGVGAGAGKPTIDPVKPKDISKDKAQSTVISSSKPEPSKVTTTGVGSSVKKDDAKSKESKVQVEVPSSATKNSAPAPAVDPFDALAGSLPSSEPVAPKGPQYTGPEIKEPSLTSEEAKRCGEKEHTLPPGYRKEDMEKKMPAGKPDKPKEVSKPLTEDDALGSLSAGFVSSAVPSAPKSQATPPISPAKAPTVSAGSGAMSGKGGAGATGGGAAAGKPNADPVKPKDTLKDKPQSTVISSSKPEPPKVTSTGVAKPSATANVSGSATQKDDIKSKEAKVHSEAAPPAAKASAPAPAVDPFDALYGSLPSSEPVAPKALQYSGPEVREPSLTSEVAFRCGENEHTLPPGYRWGDMEKKVPAGVSDKPKEVSKPLTVDDAVDSLSAGFVSSAVPSAPKPEAKAESVTAAQSKNAPPPPAQKRQDVTVPTNVSPAPPADKKAKVEKGDSISLDALSALEDTLPAAKPAPESPKLRPEDIIDEKNLTSEKGVRVGEREDTLPPGYRFSEEASKKYPAPPKEPSLDSAEALDILSGGFTSSSVAPAVQAPVPPSAPPADSSVDFALEELAGDFVAPTAASKVHSAVTAPPKVDRQLSEGTASAMDALSDTLMDIRPAPQPVPVAPKDIVKEKEAVEEKITKAGERDDTLPPDYRPTEADIKAAAEAKAKAKANVPPKQTSMDESAALDALSSDFSAPPVAAPAAAVAPPSSHPHAPPAKTPPTHSAPATSGPVLDKLATTLLPDLPETKPKESKPKVKGGKSKSKPKKPAVDDVPASGHLSGQPSTDVVSTSPTKKGGKS